MSSGHLITAEQLQSNIKYTHIDNNYSMLVMDGVLAAALINDKLAIGVKSVLCVCARLSEQNGRYY